LSGISFAEMADETSALQRGRLWYRVLFAPVHMVDYNFHMRIGVWGFFGLSYDDDSGDAGGV